MNQQFPTFHLEDKVDLELRGIVRPPIIYTYKRKGRKGNSLATNGERIMGEDRAGGARQEG